MRSTRLTLLTAVIMVAAAAGCNNDTSPARDTATTQSATATTTPSGNPANDAQAKTVCTNVSGDIETTLANVAKAEAIGPPAGHHAVSAQFSAGAAAIAEHTNAPDSRATKAAKDVGQAMADIADKYVDSTSKPDKTPLTTAIDKFKSACAAYVKSS